MKTIQNSTRWLGLALACGTLTYAATTQAGKPSKPPPEPTPSYTLTLLERGPWYVGCAVNNSGLVVGQSCRPPEYPEHPFIVVPEDTNGNGLPDQWFRDNDGDGLNDLLLELGPVPPYSGDVYYEGRADDINEAGQVVGDFWVDDYYNNTSEYVAFVVTPADVDQDGRLEWFWPDANGANALMTRLDLGLSPTTFVYPTAVNNLGQIVGRYYPSDSERGFLLEGLDSDANGVADTWFQDADQNGANDLVVDLGAAPDRSGNLIPLSPSDINDAGWVVGRGPGAFLIVPKVDPATGKRVWNEDQNGDGINDLAILLPTLGGTSAYANAINTDGVIAGSCSPRRGASHAVLWRLDAQGRATITDLGVVQGMDTSANGVNASLQVVGGAASTSTFTGWFWQNGVMTELSKLLEVDKSLKTGALGINDLGMFVGDSYGAYIAIPSNLAR